MIEKRKKGTSQFEPHVAFNHNASVDEKKAYLKATSLISLALSVVLVLIFVFYFGKDDGTVAAPITLTNPPFKISQAGRPMIPHNDVPSTIKKVVSYDKTTSKPLPVSAVVALTSPPQKIITPSVDLESLTAQAKAQISKLRDMKSHGTVMETDAEAKTQIAILQKQLQTLLPLKYGPGPYQVEMTIQFPESMLTDPSATTQEVILIDLAPVNLVPYCVYFFLEIVTNWKGGAFHRNAGHVLQAQVRSDSGGLAFQEYHPNFPHKQYTMGYAGRPGGPAFYISTVDNVQNHGPASQGSKSEADGCFGKIANQHSIDVVKRMSKQPGGQKGLGFIIDPKNNIKIIGMKLVRP